MSDSSLKSIQIQSWIDRVRVGDQAARDELTRCSCDRLDDLVMKMLGSHQRVKRWEQADDVVQKVTLEIYRRLETVSLESSRDFLCQASTHIRRELLGLDKYFFAPVDTSTGDPLATRPDAPTSGDTVAGELVGALEPGRLSAWTRFHRQIDLMEVEDREVFELLWYQGLTQPETADLIGVSRKTMIRRWQGARLRLFDAINGLLPSSD